ncbi:hypothetical protein [Micromonospora sp. DT47]|uniref:hypothetical protein n=1 Tax=Micromonospora sp. DT47 TaxID=3393431 RepID=UPI003CEBABC8
MALMAAGRQPSTGQSHAGQSGSKVISEPDSQSGVTIVPVGGAISGQPQVGCRRDAMAAFVAAMSAPDLKYTIFYAASANERGWWDHEPGRVLGYHPSGSAERHLPGSTWEPATDGVQGGVLATAAYTLDRQHPIRTRSTRS